jgi:hypothetical protein
MSSDKIEQFELPQLSALELNRIVVMDEAARLSSLSKDALQENYGELIVQLSPKRRGMRVGHALMLRKRKSA